MVLTKHKYVARRFDKPNGEPVVRGTPISVRALVEYRRLGRSDEEILETYPELTPASYHRALSFAYENMEEIEGWIYKNRLPDPGEKSCLSSHPEESPQAFVARFLPE